MWDRTYRLHWQRQRLRLREVEELSQGRTATKWWSQDLNSHLSSTKADVLTCCIVLLPWSRRVGIGQYEAWIIPESSQERAAKHWPWLAGTARRPSSGRAVHSCFCFLSFFAQQTRLLSWSSPLLLPRSVESISEPCHYFMYLFIYLKISLWHSKTCKNSFQKIQIMQNYIN